MDTTEINLVSKSRVLATWNVRGREGEKTFLVETMTRKFRVLLSVGRQILAWWVSRLSDYGNIII